MALQDDVAGVLRSSMQIQPVSRENDSPTHASCCYLSDQLPYREENYATHCGLLLISTSFHIHAPNQMTVFQKLELCRSLDAWSCKANCHSLLSTPLSRAQSKKLWGTNPRRISALLAISVYPFWATSKGNQRRAILFSGLPHLEKSPYCCVEDMTTSRFSPQAKKPRKPKPEAC